MGIFIEMEKDVVMIINYPNHKIKTYEHGYVVQKKTGSQWKVTGYYSDLRQAALGLFQHRVLTETADCIVDAIDKSSIQLQSAHILKHIDDIKCEILRGINYEAHDKSYRS